MLGIHFMSIITGGLMVCISKDKAQGFCEELKVYKIKYYVLYTDCSMWQALDGVPAWIIGDVIPGIVLLGHFNYPIVTLMC